MDMKTTEENSTPPIPNKKKTSTMNKLHIPACALQAMRARLCARTHIPNKLYEI